MRKDHAWARWGLWMLARKRADAREMRTLLLLAAISLGLGRSLAGGLLLGHDVG
jgi:hypothetical protein